MLGLSALSQAALTVTELATSTTLFCFLLFLCFTAASAATLPQPNIRLPTTLALLAALVQVLLAPSAW